MLRSGKPVVGLTRWNGDVGDSSLGDSITDRAVVSSIRPLVSQRRSFGDIFPAGISTDMDRQNAGDVSGSIMPVGEIGDAYIPPGEKGWLE
jgi:hypothetical protein